MKYSLVLLFAALIATLALGYTNTLFAQVPEKEPVTEEAAPALTEEESKDTVPPVEEQTEPEPTTEEEPVSEPEPVAEEGTDGESTDSTPPGEEGTDEGTTDSTGGETDESTDPAETATVDTGDADAVGDVETEANTNDTAVDAPDGNETTVDNTNDADADTEVAVAATSGDNEAAGNAGATITTGDATASSNVINIINTNIFDSNGLFYFLNVLAGNIAADFRNIFSILTGGVPDVDPCSATECENGDTTLAINNDNTATVDNDVTVNAGTGGNTAMGGEGDATIDTGDASASANVFNLVNTNIVGSSYLMLSVNNFGDYSQDIVFPGADWFSELLSGGAGVAAGSDVTVTNSNTAVVENNVEVGANTGDNTTVGDATVITTGDANAAATVVNQVNTNLFGDSMLFMFRIHGDWAGDVFGLPEGMSWSETDDGIALFLDPSGVAAPFGSTDNLSVTNSNTATVTNNVSVFALTGDNEASSDEGGASIATGDAYASANVVNVVNTNVLGRNWVLAIFNIFGDWSGNISFGQPDLWVGARATIPSDVHAGSCFNYEVTVNNLGDAVATNVLLDAIFNQAQQRIKGFDENLGDKLRLRIPRIAAGATYSVTFPSCLSGGLRGNTTINTGFVVTADEPDADEANNSDVLSFATKQPGGGGALRLGPSDLAITKTASDQIISASSSIDYEITITNKGDPVYNALLIDNIYGPDGASIHEQRWGLDTIFKGETIIVGYTAFFNSSTSAGIYTNEAFISGTDRHPDYEHSLGNKVDSPVASVDVLITNEELINWEYDDSVCEPLLTTYIRYGANDNDKDEVHKLQYFLKTLEGNGNVSLSGEYDDATHAAVHAFQSKYARDILDPWGIPQTTGFVYYTTQKKVNEIYCRDRAFPLSVDQWDEIEAFKIRLQTFEEAGTPLPDAELNRVGVAPIETEDRFAITDPAARPEELEDIKDETRDQVAAAAEAATSEAVTGLWQKIRQGFGGFFSS